MQAELAIAGAIATIRSSEMPVARTLLNNDACTPTHRDICRVRASAPRTPLWAAQRRQVGLGQFVNRINQGVI